MRNRTAAIAAFALLAGAATAALAFTPRSSAAPSFNCRDAASLTERAICQNASLSDMDARMARAYAKVVDRSKGSEANQLKRDQGEWLDQREQCQGNAGCIEFAYRQRLRQLGQELGWAMR